MIAGSCCPPSGRKRERECVMRLVREREKFCFFIKEKKREKNREGGKKKKKKRNSGYQLCYSYTRT
jgi:hypothetical protein